VVEAEVEVGAELEEEAVMQVGGVVEEYLMLMLLLIWQNYSLPFCKIWDMVLSHKDQHHHHL
jgi:hypothetical protein